MSAAFLVTALTVTAASFIANPAQAQTSQASDQTTQAEPSVGSRAEQIVREQAAKALVAKPYEPNGFEKTIDIAEDFILTPPTVYPWFGSIYPGGLFALGGGVRKPYGDTGLFDVHGGWSFRGYTGATASLKLPEVARGKIRLTLNGEFINAPQVAFHGVGQGSAKEATHFLYRPTTVGATLTIAPFKYLRFGGGADYIDIKTGSAKKGLLLEDRFGPIDAPGFGADPTYLRTRAFAGIDWRTTPGYTDRGGWYHVEWSDYRQRNDGPYSFRRLDAEVQQFMPILDGNWVLAFRGAVSTTDTDAGETVPFFLMPDLGGGSDLRGYPSFRFRDQHRILLTGEYRWKAGQFVDMALFADAGKVTAERRDLDLNHLKTTYGFGIRFHTPAATVLRIDIAKSRERIGIIFTAGQIF